MKQVVNLWFISSIYIVYGVIKLIFNPELKDCLGTNIGIFFD
jgi:hypothetical protein